MYYHAKLREDATLKNQIRKSLTWRRNIKYKFLSSSQSKGNNFKKYLEVIDIKIYAAISII